MVKVVEPRAVVFANLFLQTDFPALRKNVSHYPSSILKKNARYIVQMFGKNPARRLPKQAKLLKISEPMELILTMGVGKKLLAVDTEVILFGIHV